MKMFKRARTIDEIVESAAGRFGSDTNPELLGRALQAKREHEDAKFKRQAEQLTIRADDANKQAKNTLDLDPLEWVEVTPHDVRTSRPVAGGVYLYHKRYRGTNDPPLYGTGGPDDTRHHIRNLTDFATAIEKINPGKW